MVGAVYNEAQTDLNRLVCARLPITASVKIQQIGHPQMNEVEQIVQKGHPQLGQILELGHPCEPCLQQTQCGHPHDLRLIEQTQCGHHAHMKS